MRTASLLQAAVWFLSLISSMALHLRPLSDSVPYPGWRPSIFDRRRHIQQLKKRSDPKYVFMHHLVGNTYPYTQADWVDDIRKIQEKGVDALALNIGGDAWQRQQVASAYAAASELGTNFKLFLSFDLTAIGCDLNDLVDRVNQFANHPNQFHVGGRPMISSFAGKCLGNDGWANLKARTNGYLMPFIEAIEGQYNAWPSLDSWLCWGCAWPQGDVDKTTNDDNYYIGQLGPRYATTISPWMFTHYNYKNWYQRGDDWLMNTRWEQLISMRDKIKFLEILTWNDYGESHYIGPVKGAQPDGTTWANLPHTSWHDMSQYYITAFKTGSFPTVTRDIIYFWARPHPATASATSDRLSRPSGYEWTSDTLWAVAFSTSDSTVTLTCGSSSQTFEVGPGVQKLKIPLSPGKITITMVRNGVTVIDHTPSDYTFVTNPKTYNYNAYVGAANVSSATSVPTMSSMTSRTSTTSKMSTISMTSPTSTTSQTSTTSPISTTSTNSTTSTTSMMSATSTTSITSTAPAFTNACTPTSSSHPTSNLAVTWKYLGCYPDYSHRTLNGGMDISFSHQTVATCLAICAAQNYAFGGTEYGVECWCSTKITHGRRPVPARECNMPCSGNSTDICGGRNRISLYSQVGGRGA